MRRYLRQIRSLSLYFLIPALGAAAPLLVLPAVTANFGANAWASVAIAQSLGGAIAIIAELGWGVVGPQRVAGAKNLVDREAIYRSALTTKSLALVVLAPVAGISTYLLTSEFRIEAAALSVAIALGALSPAWFFIGLGRPMLVLYSDSLPRVLINVGSAAALFLGAPLVAYAFAMLLLPIATQTMAAFIVGRGALVRGRDLRDAPAIIRSQLVMAGGRTVSVVYTTLPIAMVAAVAPAAVPVFSASERLMRMALTILSGVPNRLQSWIGSATGDERMSRSDKSVRYNLILGVVCGTGFAAVAPFASTVIFAGTIDIPFEISTLSGMVLCVICFSRGLGISLVSVGQANLITVAILLAALSGSATIIPLALALGAAGPIIGELIAECVGALTQATLLLRKRKALSKERGPSRPIGNPRAPDDSPEGMGATGTLRVLYFAVHKSDYPRNTRIREYLEGMPEIDCLDIHVKSRGSRLVRTLDDLRVLIRQSKGVDVIIVSEFALQYAAPARLIARLRKSRLVVDGFVGSFETEIEDKRKHSPRSVQAIRHRIVDAVAIRSADLFLIDTRVRAEAARSRAPRSTAVISLPVGAPAWASVISPPPSTSPPLLLFYGNFLPLHGISVLIEALALIPAHVNLLVQIVGSGTGKLELVARSSELDLDSRVIFTDQVTERTLAELISQSHAVFGIFGDSAKARTVLPNKVWQGLAAGRPVITRASPAISEIIGIVGDQLRTVEPPTPERLAQVIEEYAHTVCGPDREFHAHSAAKLERYVAREFDGLRSWLLST